jgi:hypothetical protein
MSPLRSARPVNNRQHALARESSFSLDLLLIVHFHMDLGGNSRSKSFAKKAMAGVF